jgi:hypothetical protein
MRMFVFGILVVLAGCAFAAGETGGPSLKTREVDYSCKAAADCAIKDVGNCCGAYPQCVNKDSPTFPEKVKAECAAQGMSSICGFPSISGCDCVEGRCVGVPGVSGDVRKD